MTYKKDAYAFLEEAAGYGSVLGLSSIRALMERLHNPQNELEIIHVAGTNGKGSTCCFLKHVLKEAGYRVGTYTSPAVFSSLEQFDINGRAIEENRFCQLVGKLQKVCQEMVAQGEHHPTIFEIETALALTYFWEEKCDFVILEVGMGGQTDATNVIEHSLCSVFASIGRDHMKFLGEDAAAIAAIKAGIIKENGRAVSIWQEDEVEQVLYKTAKQRNASITFADRKQLAVHSRNPLTFSYKTFDQISIKMLGAYQLDNAVLALETIERLVEAQVSIPVEAVKRGMKKASWPGRMEKILAEREFYIDGAHNIPAILRLKETMEKSFTNKSITFIIGVLEDKEYSDMLRLILPLCGDCFTVTPNHPRKLDGKVLAKEIRHLGYEATFCDSIEEAVTHGLEPERDVVIAFGSLSYLREVKNLVKKNEGAKDV